MKKYDLQEEICSFNSNIYCNVRTALYCLNRQEVWINWVNCRQPSRVFARLWTVARRPRARLARVFGTNQSAHVTRWKTQPLAAAAAARRTQTDLQTRRRRDPPEPRTEPPAAPPRAPAGTRPWRVTPAPRTSSSPPPASSTSPGRVATSR